jgi:hypothetical protein
MPDVQTFDREGEIITTKTPFTQYDANISHYYIILIAKICITNI